MKKLLMGALTAVMLAGCGAAPLSGVPQATGFEAGAMAAGPYKLFTQPDGSGVAAIFGGIDGAKHSIDITMYILQDADIVTHLTAAAARGVTVRVLLEQDPFYLNANVQHRPVPTPPPLVGLGDPAPTPSPTPTPLQGYRSNQQAAADLLAKTAQAKIPAQVFWTNDAQFALTHEKSMVIDGKAAYIMSNNFTTKGLGGNREYGVIDTVPDEVAEVEKIFQADITHTPYIVPQGNLVVSPDDGSGEGNARTKLMGLISSAKHSIQIEDEEFQDPNVAQLLGMKVAQGVTVQMLISPSSKNQSDAVLLPQHVTPTYWDPAGGELHAKLIIVDGHAAYIGSVNLSTQSMGYNRELGIIFTQSALVSPLLKDFTADWQTANPAPNHGNVPTPAKVARPRMGR